MDREVNRWKRQFTISKNSILPDQSPVRMQDYNNKYVTEVIENNTGVSNNDFDSFKKMAKEQQDFLKVKYSSEIDKQTDSNLAIRKKDREHEKQ